MKSPVGRALRKGQRRIPKRALPIAGRLAGTAIGGPIGGRLARADGRIFGLELEGLTGEDQEFEVARRVVRLAGVAAKNAATQRSTGNSAADAKKAVSKAAQVHAPGLVVGARAIPAAMAAGSVRRHSGRWIRRGGKIVLMGA